MPLKSEWWKGETLDGRMQLFSVDNGGAWFDMRDPEVCDVLVKTLRREHRHREAGGPELAMLGAFEAGKEAGRAELLCELDLKPWWKLLWQRLRGLPDEEDDEEA